MELGIIGLGRIGGNLALQCTEKGIWVVGKARSPKPYLADKSVKVVEEYEEFVNSLKKPRVIFLSLPAGRTIDNVLKELVPHLDKGDVVIDGGNSYYKDSIRREAELSKLGIHFVDCGTSGGVEGARNGACFMVGGRYEGVKLCKPILKALAVEGGYLHTGPPGSGHFVKLVHNGIEFGMFQAIGEGVELLKRSNFNLNLEEIFRNWSNGSVIRGWLIELMERGLREIDDLAEIPDYVEDTGEVNWLVQEAIEKEIPIPVITHSVIELFRSREGENNSARAIAIMRHGFGGHPYGRDEYIAKERKTSRIHPI
ncbi:MAG: phosphogluconate dehydrogenase (NAD(+)-dependent, decarboxylating) [Candidatus Hydrothermarchaeota archaeon]